MGTPEYVIKIKIDVGKLKEQVYDLEMAASKTKKGSDVNYMMAYKDAMEDIVKVLEYHRGD